MKLSFDEVPKHHTGLRVASCSPERTSARMCWLLFPSETPLCETVHSSHFLKRPRILQQ